MDEGSQEWAGGAEAEAQKGVCCRTEWGMDSYQSLKLEIFGKVHI